MNTTESRLSTASPVLEKIHPTHKLFSHVCYAAVYISICTAPTAMGKDKQQLPGKEPVVSLLSGYKSNNGKWLHDMALSFP